MTVLSRGARVRRGGRRPGWVLLTALLVLAMGASSALVFTNRVELLKLAVILALWAAVAGAFVSVLYRRQSDADQSKVRDLKLVYDLQLDREISARREYELTVESQLRRELASELRAQAADEVAALRAELAALRTSLEILFDTDLDHRRALENSQSDWARNGESAPVDWVSSDRVSDGSPGECARADRRIADHRRVRGAGPAGLAPRRPAPPREQVRPPYQAPPPPPEPQPQPQMQPESPQWQPAAADGQWLPAGAPGSNWSGADEADTPDPLTGRRRARHSSPDESRGRPAWRVRRVGSPVAVAAFDGVPRRRRCGRAGHRDERAATATAAAAGAGATARADTPASQRRCGSGRPEQSEGRRSQSGGQSVADLLARLQVEPTGRRRAPSA